MSDNIQITAGAGTTLATDQIPDNSHVQFVKLMDGTLDGTGKIAGDATYGLDVDVTRIGAAENFIGRTGITCTTVDFTLSLAAATYDAGDVLADTQEISNCLRVTNGTAELVEMVVLDEDDQAAADTTFWFFESNVSLGTENAAISITDANARAIIGKHKVLTADWEDLIGSKVAIVKPGLLLTGAAGSTSLYMAVSTAGTPTCTANGITGHLMFKQY